jgi:hypothetical protein
MFVRRGGGLGNHGGHQLHGVKRLLGWAWAAIFCCLGDEVVGSVDASQRRRFDVTSGRRPRTSWCDGRGLRPVTLCSLGYGWMVRAALQLECERWYVGAAAPEGGELGCPCRARRSCGMLERRLRAVENFKVLVLVSCGR